MSADGLRPALEELDAYWSARDPNWASGLHPGLSGQAIDRAEQKLKPMRLTDEHRVLYAWHDGDGEKSAFGNDWPSFLSLADAIEQWRFGHQELGWTPCWFPLLNTGQDYRITLIDSVPMETTGVLDFYLQAEPEPLVPNIEALVRWRLEWLRQGITASNVYGLTRAQQDAVDRIRRRFDGPILVRGQRLSTRISAVFARDWPPAWKQAAGIDQAAEKPVGATITVSELLATHTDRGVIQGRVTGLGGNIDASVTEIDDGTGRVVIACPEGTPGVRELGMALVVEVTVRRRTKPLDPRLAFLAGILGDPPFVAESLRFVRSLREEDQDPSRPE